MGEAAMDTGFKASQADAGRILVVDDNAVISGMLAVTLGTGGHAVVEAESGFEALAHLEAQVDTPPDVVFLDIEMAGINGYETCRRIKAMDAGRTIPVIFLSGHDGLEDRLQAFDAGGDDFMAKPFAPEEVLRKAAVAVRHRRHQAAAREDSSAAIGAAMTAMSSLGETGAAVRFANEALRCRSFRALADAVVEAMASYALDCHVQLRGGNITVTRTARGAASPLEESVIDKVKETGRIFSFKNRMVVNYDTVSLLVTDMPLDNPDFCGRIRDHAAMIAEAAVLALDNIAMRKAAIERTRELQEVAHMTVAAVDTLRQNYRELQMATRVNLEGMVTEIETMYHRLGLTPSQEDTISDAVRGATDQVVDLFEGGIEIDQSLGAVVGRLQNVADLPLEEEDEDVTRIELW